MSDNSSPLLLMSLKYVSDQVSFSQKILEYLWISSIFNFSIFHCSCFLLFNVYKWFFFTLFTFFFWKLWRLTTLLIQLFWASTDMWLMCLISRTLLQQMIDHLSFSKLPCWKFHSVYVCVCACIRVCGCGVFFSLWYSYLFWPDKV